MSLVNDMLRDLDRRRRLPTGSAVSGYRNDDNNDSGKASWKLVLLTVGGLVVGIGAGYLYFSQTFPSVTDNEAIAASGNRAESQATILDSSGITGDIQVQSVNATPAGNSVTAVVTSETERGFVLRLASAREFSYEVIARDRYSINILLNGIENFERNAMIGGFSFIQSTAGVHAVIELNEPAGFLLDEQKNAGGMTLIIEAVLASAETGEELLTSADLPESPDNSENSGQASQVATTNPQVSSQRTATTTAESTTSIRTPRELSFAERDLSASQRAAQLMQRGQMVEAYRSLLEFIGENPEAHRSRETLATLLFAQQEFEQARAIVDQGLALAPNYGAYKKIKTRLLLMEKQPAEAALLLNNNPPVIATDPEYFELLASSYQQGGEHQNAIETYQQLIRHDRNIARWWAGMGISHEALGNVNEAVASFQAAMQSPDLEPALRQYSQNRIRYLGN